LQSYSHLHRILRLTNHQLTRLRFINIFNKTADTAFQTETDSSAPHKQSDQAPRWTAPVAGLISSFFAVCVATFIAVLLDVVTPLNAVGSEFIDHTPKWLKNFSIQTFGTNDKAALKIGMVLTISCLALLNGLIARRKLLVGTSTIISFGILGGIVSSARPLQSALALVPCLLGATAGCWLLTRLIKIITQHDLPIASPSESRAPLGWDRRRFLSATGKTALISALLGVVANRLENKKISEIRQAAPESLPKINTGNDLVATKIPSAAQIFTETPFITPNEDFYRIDTALSLPRIDIKTWTLQIGGMVKTPLKLSYDDLLARPMVERTITICCVSNEVGGPYIGNAIWQGVLLADLLNEAGVDPRAEQIFGTSADGWTCGFPVGAAFDGRDALIAIGMNGTPLPLEHGYPARVIIPGLYGYVSATKWLTNLDLTTWSQEQGYWVPLGWSRDAPIKTQSRIDVPRRGENVTAGRIAIAGVAWAQQLGIEKVEVRIDSGDWQNATLALDFSDDTWRQWKYEFDAKPGDYKIQVRATDKTGETQTQEVSRPDPNGATGYHTRTIKVL
jgi:DMSO/TMAO reductase YedYZ molybdopterin-dependent catalytic subunit